MSAPTRCVICLNYPKSKKKLIPKHSVEEQTLIMYFLRKLAWTPIPEDDLQTFLKVGNPSEWASFCYICEEQVKKCYDMHRKIKEMIDEITEIRKKLYQENFYESDDEDGRGNTAGSRGGVTSIFNKLREQLFSDFKEDGGNSSQFDKSIMLAYKNSSEEGRPPATGPSSKVGIVKTEPISEDENEDQDHLESIENDNDPDYQEDGDYHPDSVETSRAEFQIAHVIVEAKPSSSKSKAKTKVEPEPYEFLNEITGLMEKSGQAKWSLVQMSEETIKKDFRVHSRRNLKGGQQTHYYCAYGVPKKKCPVRVKVKLLYNGVRVVHKTNHEHFNHRVGIRGMSNEQKQFVNDCIAKGVERTFNILQSFRDSGLEEPEKFKLTRYLNNNREKIKLKTDPGEMLCPDGSDKNSEIATSTDQPKEDNLVSDQPNLGNSS